MATQLDFRCFQAASVFKEGSLMLHYTLIILVKKIPDFSFPPRAFQDYGIVYSGKAPAHKIIEVSTMKFERILIPQTSNYLNIIAKKLQPNKKSIEKRASFKTSRKLR